MIFRKITERPFDSVGKSRSEDSDGQQARMTRRHERALWSDELQVVFNRAIIACMSQSASMIDGAMICMIYALVQGEASKCIQLIVEVGELVSLDESMCSIVPLFRHKRARQQSTQWKLFVDCCRKADQWSDGLV